eukprot:CAMPEP_0206219046 /NCGR_PEP_ID=MMETSP0047_2-20121206/4116_1 /ASSEMBLY_ACC=CAM_ASM_000192 /TAXON_ID=195065 /ORGANISM="Chroomonas mesostigmatica_cf, Strain CCMP1168" /LENGTH=92 /DNA_ID=CAMNT_0053641575 /DNA_START=730 /DNA_END=1008 /DNA_ORIENTATION=+
MGRKAFGTTPVIGNIRVPSPAIGITALRHGVVVSAAASGCFSSHSTLPDGGGLVRAGAGRSSFEEPPPTGETSSCLLTPLNMLLSLSPRISV